MTMFFTRHPVIWDEKTKSMKRVTVRVEIDVDKLAEELARRTNRSKSKKSCIHGNIIVATQEPEE